MEEQSNPKDHVLGGVFDKSGPVLVEDGQWLKYLPIKEYQAKFTETNSCMSFAWLNVMEIMNLRLFGKEVNYSDRYLAIASGTGPNGNTPTKVCETQRSISGAIPEEMLPFSEDIDSQQKYLSPNPLDKKYYDEGRKWLEKYEARHYWVPTDAMSLMLALKKSPLVVSVVAWQENNGIYIRPPGYNDNHATVLFGYVENEYWLIWDSYPDTDGEYLKKLSWDFKFGIAKGANLAILEKESWWKRWWKNLLKGLNLI